MDERPKAQQIGSSILALLLWLISFVLGLNAIYVLLQLFYLVYGAFGGSLIDAERMGLGLVFILGLGFLIFIIVTSEFHRKNVGTPKSWRLFAWTIGIEVSLIIIYYLV